MLKLESVSSYYGESRVISDLSLHVQSGKIVCLVGRNGVGKSTALKSIMGLIKSPTGHILFGESGADIRRMRTHERVRQGIGYVPQGREIFSQMTVQENLELGLQAVKGKGKIPEYIYELFPIIQKFRKRKGGDLSGGQQQQLAIARALVAEPKLLILDEPTEGIQPSIIQDIGASIEKINKWKGMTIFIVEQYLDFVMEISNYIYVMEKGSIILEGNTSDMPAGLIQQTMTEGTVPSALI